MSGIEMLLGNNFMNINNIFLAGWIRGEVTHKPGTKVSMFRMTIPKDRGSRNKNGVVDVLMMGPWARDDSPLHELNLDGSFVMIAGKLAYHERGSRVMIKAWSIRGMALTETARNALYQLIVDNADYKNEKEVAQLTSMSIDWVKKAMSMAAAGDDDVSDFDDVLEELEANQIDEQGQKDISEVANEHAEKQRLHYEQYVEEQKKQLDQTTSNFTVPPPEFAGSQDEDHEFGGPPVE